MSTIISFVSATRLLESRRFVASGPHLCWLFLGEEEEKRLQDEKMRKEKEELEKRVKKMEAQLQKLSQLVKEKVSI